MADRPQINTRHCLQVQKPVQSLPGSYFNKITMYAMIIYKDVHFSIIYVSKKYGYKLIYIAICLSEDAAYLRDPPHALPKLHPQIV